MSERLVRLLHQAYAAPDAGASDADLLARVAAKKDDAAFELLVRRHAELVWRVCRQVARDHHAAEDAFQAAFLALARRAAAVRGDSAAGFLHRVAFHAALKAKPTAPAGPLPVDGPAAPTPSPDRQAEAAELAPLLHAELNRLPDRYRLPLVLCHLEGHTQAEAAARLGWPVGTVATRVRRGGDRLRDQLTRRGVGVPAAGVATLLAGPDALALSRTLVTHTAGLGTAAGVPGPAVARLASGALSAMRYSQVRTWLAASVAAVVGVGGMAWSVGQPPRPTPQPAAAAKPSAVESVIPVNGVYESKWEGEGVSVIQTDGTRCILGRRVSGSIGTSASLVSLSNDNSRFDLLVKGLESVPERGQYALVVDGVSEVFSSSGPPRPDGTVSEARMGIHNPDAAKTLAARYKVEPRLRTHPGHRLEARWTTDKPSYAVGEPVMLRFVVRNTGNVTVRFTVGGKQRGARDNQFRFLAYGGFGRGKPVPDSGDPDNYGGMAGMKQLEPGNEFSTQVDLGKWFKFTDPDVYRITGMMELPLGGPFETPYWDELVVAECLVRVTPGNSVAHPPRTGEKK